GSTLRTAGRGSRGRRSPGPGETWTTGASGRGSSPSTTSSRGRFRCEKCGVESEELQPGSTVEETETEGRPARDRKIVACTPDLLDPQSCLPEPENRPRKHGELVDGLPRFCERATS